MVVCHLCKEEFKDNLGGQLTNHLINTHNISKEDYIIITELNGINPICICGYCKERPSFYRGKFKKYATGHDSFKWKEEQYLKIFGDPRCKTCGEIVKFFRGSPNKYCDSGCRPSCWNQEKVKSTVKEKYGVDNVMQVEEFKDKISNFHKKLWECNYDIQLEKVKKTNLERFGVEFVSQNEIIKERQKEKMLKNHGVTHYSKTEKFRIDSSQRMILNNPMKNPETALKTNFSRAFNNKWSCISKKFKSTDLCYQSSYEYDFLEFCEKNNIIHLIKKSPTFRYINKESYHFPDYLFDDRIIIEVKSKWIFDIQGGESIIKEKIKSVEFNGKYKYLLLLDKDYIQFENILELS